MEKIIKETRTASGKKPAEQETQTQYIKSRLENLKKRKRELQELQEKLTESIF